MAKFTPRIIMTVSNDSVSCKGNYIDKFERIQSINRTYKDEQEAEEYLTWMRDTNEFSIQINRINWKA